MEKKGKKKTKKKKHCVIHNANECGKTIFSIYIQMV